VRLTRGQRPCAPRPPAQCVIKLFEVVETPRNLFLVMEHAPSGSLLDYVRARKRLPEADACVFFQQIVASLEYCHSREVRDQGGLGWGRRARVRVSAFGTELGCLAAVWRVSGPHTDLLSSFAYRSFTGT
jgi:serine/threonine protein kinase